MAYQPDINAMRANYANALAQQQAKALRGVQDIYAQRGVTGGGEEAVALGELGNQFGAAAGQAENQLQQYLGNLGQQQYQFNRNMNEQARQFDVGQGNWQNQFNFNKGITEAGLTGQYNGQQTMQSQQQQFANNLSLLPLVQQGVLSQQGAYGNNNPFGQITTDQQLYQQSPEYQFAQQLGYSNPTQMAYAAQADPVWFKNNMFNKGIYGENMGSTGSTTGTPQSLAAALAATGRGGYYGF